MPFEPYCNDIDWYVSEINSLLLELKSEGFDGETLNKANEIHGKFLEHFDEVPIRFNGAVCGKSASGSVRGVKMLSMVEYCDTLHIEGGEKQGIQNSPIRRYLKMSTRQRRRLDTPYVVFGLLLLVHTAEATETYQSLNDSTHGYAISLPTTPWERMSGNDPRLNVAAAQFGRPDIIAVALTHKDTASIVLTIETGRVNLPLTEDALREGLRKLTFPPGHDARVESVEFTKIDGYNALKLIIDMHLANAPARQKQWHFILPAGSKTFHLMLTTFSSRFSEMAPTFKRVVDSFEWTSGPWIKLGSGTIFDNVLRNMLIGGLVFLVIGVLVSMMRKRGKAIGG